MLSNKLDYFDRIKVFIRERNWYIFQIKPGGKLHTHMGSIYHDELLNYSFGDKIELNSGTKAYILRPDITDNSYKIERQTQIVYPKDAGFIISKLDIKEGTEVIEIGLGSGSMCGFFSRYVGESGRVFTYEKREEFLKISMANLMEWDVLNRVVFHFQDIEEGIKEKNADSVFIDIPIQAPQIEPAWDALKGGGAIGVLCPTVNQCSDVISAMERSGFVNIEMWESIFRNYKTNPERIRPMDKMVGHTAYIVFAKKINEKNPEVDLNEEKH